MIRKTLGQRNHQRWVKAARGEEQRVSDSNEDEWNVALETIRGSSARWQTLHDGGEPLGSYDSLESRDIRLQLGLFLHLGSDVDCLCSRIAEIFLCSCSSGARF